MLLSLQIYGILHARYQFHPPTETDDWNIINIVIIISTGLTTIKLLHLLNQL